MFRLLCRENRSEIESAETRTRPSWRARERISSSAAACMLYARTWTASCPPASRCRRCKTEALSKDPVTRLQNFPEPTDSESLVPILTPRNTPARSTPGAIMESDEKLRVCQERPHRRSGRAFPARPLSHRSMRLTAHKSLISTKPVSNFASIDAKPSPTYRAPHSCSRAARDASSSQRRSRPPLHDPL
jgi:hypothetical protein